MSDSQKFIARNRAPRVQIEYDVELYGAEKKVQLPFVMGVFSDLSGKSEKPPVDNRKFLEIDVENFDERMKSVAPRAQFSVPNTLTGDGNLTVDLTFEKMDDFSPTAIASKVDTLKPLLDARTQLSNLMTYMDGKAGAEALLDKIVSDPALLAALGGGATAQTSDTDATLAGLKAAVSEAEPKEDGLTETLSALAAQAPTQAAPDTSVADALSTLTPVAEEAPEDKTSDVLAGLADATPSAPEPDGLDVDGILGRLDAPAIQETKDTSADVLAGIDAPALTDDEDSTDDVLAGIEAVPDVVEQADPLDDVLSAIDGPGDVADPGDNMDDVLSGIEAPVVEESDDQDLDVLLGSIKAPTEDAADDVTNDVLAGIEAPAADAKPTDDLDDILGSVDASEPVVEEGPDIGDVLQSIEVPETTPEENDETDDVLAGLESRVATEEPDEDLDALLGSIEAPDEPAAEQDDLDSLLGGIETIDTAEGDDGTDDILAGLDEPDVEEEESDDLDAVLGSIEAALEDDADDHSTDDVLASVETPVEDEDEDDEIDVLLSGLEPVPEAETAEDTVDVLAGLEAVAGASAAEDDLDGLLSDLAADAPEEADDNDDLDALLGDLAEDAPKEAVDEGDLDALLSGIEAVEETPETDKADDILAGLDAVEEQTTDEDDLDVLLGDLAETSDDATPATEDDLDALLGDLDDDVPREADDNGDDLDALLNDLGSDTETEKDTDTPDEDDDLDALLAGLGNVDDPAVDEDAGDDLDALLNDLEEAPEAAEDDIADDDLDALLAGLGSDDDTSNDNDDADDETLGDADDLDAPLTDGDAAPATVAAPTGPRQSPFGTMTPERPARDSLHRPTFRIALFGDFTGRAARGLMEVGDALAEKTAIELDVDTIDDVIARFATTLTLPMGTEGKGIEIKLNELEDLHPDELYENVELFAAIAGLRQQLNVGSMAANTVGQLQSWSQEFGQSIKIPKRSASTSIPADRKLSDFQALIGDTTGRLTQASPAEDFIAQIVGPHVLKAPDAGAEGMKQAVDEALSGAMRMILHHPDFQALEAQWRSLDFLARRIETDSTLRIDLFDVSAEELATDLASQEELSESGLFRLLNRDLDPEDGAGGFSALFGLYTFEETPPHAELLARVAHVAAHVDAPFFAAMSPSYLETAMEDRHPLVAERWDQVRGLVDAGYLGLASPRFLLRQPYGSKSEPIDEFEFEEFTAQEGLRGMLWANPVVLVAVLLTATHKKDGKAMNLGSLMSLGDLPFFYTNDRFGDQVALPCTERNLTSDPAQATLARGYMPVVWVKGRNEVRLASFRSLGGDEILGPWAGDLPQPPPQPTPVAADVEVTLNTDGDVDDDDLDALLTGLDSGDDDDTDLDDLLAGFGDDDEGGDEDDMDADLAALLEGL